LREWKEIIVTSISAGILFLMSFTVLAHEGELTSSRSLASTPEIENSEFSGTFQVQSCSPQCEEAGFAFSVTDNPARIRKTCDGKPPLEINAWAYDQLRWYEIFSRHNLAGVYSGCEATGTLDANSVSAPGYYWNSPRFKLTKISGDHYELTYTSTLTPFDGKLITYQLKKVEKWKDVPMLFDSYEVRWTSVFERRYQDFESLWLAGYKSVERFQKNICIDNYCDDLTGYKSLQGRPLWCWKHKFSGGVTSPPFQCCIAGCFDNDH
jgi:hypothetical protein